MSKNLMPEVLKMLGVEYGEKFKLKSKDSVFYEDGLFYFDKENGFLRFMDEEHIEEVYDMVYDVLNGYYEIDKLPWEPGAEETFYFPDIFTHEPCLSVWEYSTKNLALKALGLVYRTPEEVRANFAEDYEKLTGKPLEV